MRFLLAHINRKALMFLFGAGGFTHEIVVTQGERPVALALCGALMGLPFVLKGEEALRQERTRRDDEDLS